MGVNQAKLIADLRRDEGVVPYAYEDHLGFLTIGVGRLIDKRKGGRLTQDEIDYLLKNDIREKTAELEASLPWVRDLDEVRHRALVNMAFQLGVAGLLGFVTTLGLLKEKNYHEAAMQMLKSKWASQTPARARRIAQMIDLGTEP
jgi:lysozyme